MRCIAGRSLPDRASGSSDAESVGNTIDIVEPGRDQIDLQNSRIVEPLLPQVLHVCLLHPDGMSRQQSHIIQHCTIRRVQVGSAIIYPEGGNQRIVSGDSTQKLCVRFRSIVAVVEDGNDRRDHLMLAAGERQFRREQRSQRGKGMVECIRQQTV